MKSGRIPIPIAIAVVAAALALAVWQFALRPSPKDEQVQTTKDLPTNMKVPPPTDPNAAPPAVSGTQFARPGRPGPKGR